jgi:4-hydroxy-tetrahydrodipicolinate synthase
MLRLTGTLTAIVTPFSPGADSLDLGALDALVEAQIEGGVSGIVACGTTGEAPTLTEDEQLVVLKRVVEVTKKRVPVIAGTGSFSTKKTIQASKAAIAAGVDGVMIVMPYYNKPSQDGMREHVLACAREIDRPIVLYNIPGRCGVDLSAEATERIAAGAPNVVAIKDATGNILRCQEIVRRLGDRLTVLSGDDALTVGMMACGATGVISVTSNVLPKAVSDVTRLALAGDFAAARSLHLALLEMHGLLFVEPNPAPTKAALAALKRMNDSLRLPLVPASEATRRQIAEAMARLATRIPAVA